MSGARAHRALATLRGKGWRLAAAESCTGGQLLAVLTASEGASEVVWGGAVVYSAEAKCSLAGVDPELVDEAGVVSEAVTAALAQGIRRRAEVSFGLGVTGWAGPTSDGPDPVGTVYVGVAGPEGTRVRRHEIAGGREAVRAGAVAAVLGLLLEELGEDATGEGRPT